MDIAGPLLPHVAEQLALLIPILRGGIPRELSARFQRAVEWIGGSATREHHDDKVVDLCTALETLFTTQSDPRKGEAVALRIMLLSLLLNKSFHHPGTTYALYSLRSRVIHGSDIRICSKRDYLTLRVIAMESLLNALDVVKKERIVKQYDLISALETKILLEIAVTWLSHQSDPDSKPVLNHASKLMGAFTA